MLTTVRDNCACEAEPYGEDIASMIRAYQQGRYLRAVEAQGVGFTELRTPPASLPRDHRGVHIVPPVELFGEHAHPRTAGLLAGTDDGLEFA